MRDFALFLGCKDNWPYDFAYYFKAQVGNGRGQRHLHRYIFRKRRFYSLLNKRTVVGISQRLFSRATRFIVVMYLIKWGWSTHCVWRLLRERDSLPTHLRNTKCKRSYARDWLPAQCRWFVQPAKRTQQLSERLLNLVTGVSYLCYYS